MLKKFWIILNIPRFLPSFFFASISNNKGVIREDIDVWRKWKEIDCLPFFSLMTLYKEFRNLLYMRIGWRSFIIRWLAPPLSDLYLVSNNIGSGLMIQHGFATIINAQSIGNNVHIYQQVTIGMNKGGRPIIGNNVKICSGAKVFGGISIGNDVVIGANAVVNKSIPDCCVVGGVPAKIIRFL